jgi:hypothetical protein
MSSPCFVRHTGTAADLYDVHGQRLPMQRQGNSSDLLLTVLVLESCGCGVCACVTFFLFVCKLHLVPCVSTLDSGPVSFVIRVATSNLDISSQDGRADLKS